MSRKRKAERVKATLALLLAAVGGYVDAACFLLLFHTFVAHLSGDSISTAIHAGQREWAQAFHRAFPIPMFVLGALFGSLAAETLARRKARAVFAGPLALEAALLLAFVLLASPSVREGALRPDSDVIFYALAALPAVAMGLQSALLWRVGGTRVRTTFITGVLVSFTEEVVKFLFWFRGHYGPRGLSYLLRVSPRHPSFRRLLLLLGLWSAYVLGALEGTLAEWQWPLLSLLVPVAGLAVAVALDLAVPVLPPGARAWHLR